MDANANLTPLQRFLLAFVAFFYVLFDSRFAQAVALERARTRGALPPGPSPEPAPAARPAAPAAKAPPAAAPAPAPAPAAAKPAAPDHAEALQVLALLQRDGRLVDFCSESLEGFTDSEIGAAARTVHAGCKKVIDAYVQLEPIYRDAEGASVQVATGFDPAAVRLSGNVVGAPPFRGSLRHHGWRAVKVAFPALPSGQDPRILAPAEVEL